MYALANAGEETVDECKTVCMRHTLYNRLYRDPQNIMLQLVFSTEHHMLQYGLLEVYIMSSVLQSSVR